MEKKFDSFKERLARVHAMSSQIGKTLPPDPYYKPHMPLYTILNKKSAPKRLRDDKSDYDEKENYQRRKLMTQQGNSVTDIVEDKISVPDHLVGLLIGKGGENLKGIHADYNVVVYVEAPTGEPERMVKLTGKPSAVEEAKRVIRLMIGDIPDGKEVIITVPASMIGLIVGTKASTLKEIQRKCSVMVRIPPQNEVDPGALDRDLRVVGTEEGISAARDMISKILDDGYLSQVNSQRQQSGTPPAVNDHDFRHERSQVPSDFGIHPSRQEYHRETRRPGYGGMEDRPVYRYLMTDIPREYASLIIGKSGERIQNMRRMTNCKITVEHLVEMSDRTQKFKISGTDEDLSKCVQMINDLLVQHDYTPIDFENQTNPRHLQDLKPLEVVQQQIHQQFQQSLQQQMLARSEPGQVSPPPAHRDAVEEFSAGW